MESDKKISCLLIDDEPGALRQFESVCGETGLYDFRGGYSCPDEYKLAAVQDPPDILFFDVEMPKKDGIELAREIAALNLPSKVVFVTGFREYAFQAIKVQPFSYLTKPVTPGDLKELAASFYTNRAKPFQEGSNNERLRFNTANGFLLLDPGKIMTIQADGNYSLATMDTGQEHLITYTLKKISEQVGKDLLFRASRSLMVNLKYITFVDRKNCTCHLESEKHSMEISVHRIGIKKLSECLGTEE